MAKKQSTTKSKEDKTSSKKTDEKKVQKKASKQNQNPLKNLSLQMKPKAKGSKSPKKPDPKQQLFSQFLTGLIIILAVIVLFSAFTEQNTDQNELTLSELAAAIQTGTIESIVVERGELTITDTEGTESMARKENEASLSETLTNLGVTTEQLNALELSVVEPSGFAYFLERFGPTLLWFLLFAGLFFYLLRPGKGGSGGAGPMQAFSFGNSRAKLVDPSDDSKKIKFKDVAGAEEAKVELEEIVDFLKNPKKFLNIGADIPKGALLMGPPGTGKTLLARAVAGEAGVPFFSVSASEFVEMFVGVGASRVRDLFKMAKKSSPAIIFIDEIDAIGRVRGGGTGGGNDEREQTLNQILVEMDGFEKNEAVIVIAATNRPEVLDPALLRPGRFDRRISIDLPDRDARFEILKIHSDRKSIGDDVKLEEIAKRTPGMSGADLYSVMNEAAIFAGRDNRKEVTQYDIVQAVEKVAIGPERRSRRMDKQDRDLTAYHEVGHALLATVQEHADPVAKVTIIPRGRALGFVYQVSDTDRFTMTKNDFLANIAVALAGHATEMKYFGDVSTGPSNDLQQATGIARNMVTRFGMSDKAGVMAWTGDGKDVFGSQGATAEHSEAMATMLDTEVMAIMDERYKFVQSVLDQYEDAHEQIAQRLLEDETYDKEEFEEVLKDVGVPIKNREMRSPKGIKKFTAKLD